MKIKLISLFSVCLFLFSALTYFLCNPYPQYVQNAIDTMSNKMSYSYGETNCQAEKNASNWVLTCSPTYGKPVLKFRVEKERNDNYLSVNSFYLVADNENARAEACGNTNEELLAYLRIKMD